MRAPIALLAVLLLAVGCWGGGKDEGRSGRGLVLYTKGLSYPLAVDA